jgi:anti-sigma factor RsiW
MSSIDPAELSALLDGELHPERASVVRQAIVSDPVLRAEFEMLKRLDCTIAEAAAAAAFEARVIIPEEVPQSHLLRSVAAFVPALCALLVVYLLPKLLNLALSTSVFLHIIPFALIMVWAFRFVMSTEEVERERCLIM